MNKTTIRTLREMLGCRTDQIVRIVYGFATDTLVNWKKNRMKAPTRVLLKLVIAQNKRLTPEQKEEIIKEMVLNRDLK